MKSLYSYYLQQTILPTFANFKGKEELARYAELRDRLFAEKLYLPRRYFNDLSILQFGPDSGEDALVFAGNGARLTMVEPNPRAHPTIAEYFERFGLSSSLEALISGDVETFQSDRQFDLIDAEGFIYTVQPISNWLASFNRLLLPRGMFVITYYDRLGGFVELCLKAIYHSTRRLRGGDDDAAASSLYANKWDSIPHTRRFESWVMDVLQNPFVRLQYFLDAADLCQQAFAHGFDVYSSWPSYRDSLDMYWHKRQLPREELLRRSEAHIARSALSFLTGYKCYLHSPDLAWVWAVGERVDRLVEDVDALIEETDEAALTRVLGTLQFVEEVMSSDRILCADGDQQTAAASLIRSLRHAFEFIREEDLQGVRHHASSDADFIAGWGVPNHVGVFTKFSDDSSSLA